VFSILTDSDITYPCCLTLVLPHLEIEGNGKEVKRQKEKGEKGHKRIRG
jgi:hypothetical protein